ncbi:glycosyltransferase family 4 protein [Paenarthrobacter nicotinovorans]|uniref:glycosyltransferase family 4 protein n=1 Tax=Paenarthrobacter nicotinovorans TaxID=29320 RepID=UPI0011AA4595|nr:glycosyltransferase family 4 protein [Paenarthrobacter nicotinovorans]
MSVTLAAYSLTVKNPKLRVTIIGLNYSPEPTGNAPYTTSLAEGLSSAGHDVTVITGYPHYPMWKRSKEYTGWARTELINGVRVKRLRHYVPATPTMVNRMHMELSFGLRVMFTGWGKPDAVLVVSPALFSSGMAIARAKLKPNRPAVGLWVQDIYSRGIVETRAGGSLVAQAMGTFESLVLRGADGVAAIHERFKQFIVDSLSVAPERVKVIRNWTHLPASPTSGQQEMRARLCWEPDDVVVLHAGNMGMKQGLENVVDAARIAEQNDSRLRFVLMGDGNQRRKLEDMAHGLHRIEFLDPLPGEDFQLALSAADFLLVNELPGVKDMAVPSKLTSYFNAGVPVVAATDDGSVTAAEIASSGGGVRVDAACPEKLVETIELLSREPQRKRNMAASGLRFRQVTLSEDTAIAHYDEFLSSIVSARSH